MNKIIYAIGIAVASTITLSNKNEVVTPKTEIKSSVDKTTELPVSTQPDSTRVASFSEEQEDL